MKNHRDVILVPYKTRLEANNHLIEKPSDEHEALIASLPLQPITMGPLTAEYPLKLYKGVWLNNEFLRGSLIMKQSFKSCPTDIFLATFPKSGTTWLTAMIFATLTRNSYPVDQHPLHTYNPHQCIPLIEREYANGRSKITELIPSPRLMSTHLPYSVLSESITLRNPDCLCLA